MSPEIVLALRRPLLLSCIALALSGAASADIVRPHAGSARVGARLDAVIASSALEKPASAHLDPRHIESVFNCADSGTGSLRDAVAAAAEGDTIDLTQLNCSLITLTTGSIQIAQDNLSLVGPGTSLFLTQYGRDRILTHTGTGFLSVTGMTIANGYTSDSGGCIRSAGNLALTDVFVQSCQSGNPNTTALVIGGGGVFVAGDLAMSRSAVERNLCYSAAGGLAFGGGVYVHGAANIDASTISANYIGFGNRPGNVGGISIAGTGPSVIVNSTIADNFATHDIGGLYAYAQLTLSNSTISFNQATNGDTPTGAYLYNGPLAINSTILSNNTWGNNYEFDLVAWGAVTGTNNLIMGSNDSPPGTLTADPHLQRLAYNGGPTRTCALIATSAAVDAGNNVAGLSTDQRGAGFARLSGSQVDIGAFELQVAPPMTYTIGGNVGGLAGNGLVLQQSGGDDLPISASGSFTFITPVGDGGAYDVSVLVQPNSPNQTCVVANGEGSVEGANITNVAVACTTLHYTVGGSVNGLIGSGLVLRQSGGDDLPISTDGSFAFPTSLADGSVFSVSVSAQPSNPAQTCVVANGNGTLAGADISDVAVTCSSDIADRIFASGFEVDG